MPIELWCRRIVSAFVLTGLLSACGGQSTASPVLRSSPTHPGWLVFAESDTLRVEFDTAGLSWYGGRAPVWIGFVSVVDERNGIVAAPFRRFETQQDVNCMMRIARGISIRTPDSTGTLHVYPVRDTSWALFAEHPLGPEVLRALCQATGQPK